MKMQTKNYYLIIAGAICFFTALLHTIGGQLDLIDPMLESNLKTQTKTELLGAWHMVTVIIFVAAIVFLKNGFRPVENQNYLVRLMAWLFILFSVVFIGVSVFNKVLAPQWILCLPIGILALLGAKPSTSYLPPTTI